MLTPAPHRLILAALVVTLLTLAVVAQPGLRAGARRGTEGGPRPAALPLPSLPGVEDVDPEVAPRPRPLERDAVLTDRFTAQGQRVAYPFQAEEGELSLLELSAAGYARGWEMGAALRVLAPDGQVLASSSLKGGAQIQALLPFVAPRPGLYRLEIETDERFFRYALVRHSDYGVGDGTPLDVGRQERMHGWTGAERRALYRIPVRAGERLALSIEATRAEARAGRHRRLAQRAAAAELERGREPRGREARTGTPRLYPVLDLEVLGAPRPAIASTAFALLAPAPTDGTVQLAVGCSSGEAAALFDLVVRRDVPTHVVGGLVVDSSDEPLAGVEVRLLLEPDLEPWGTATTDAAGAWSAHVPAGPYHVVLRRAGSVAVQAASAAVRGATELNLLWRGP